MCGIAGAIWFEESERVSADQLRQMRDVLTHRGPNAGGEWFAGNSSAGVALGHRRLSIIDLSDAGQQPMGNEDDQIQVVFNGEIYNYVELREDLLKRGHQFRSHTDTEVIVHLYEEYGAACVDHLRGMFAIAIYDSRDHSVLLFRDRMGQKPLYYRQTSAGLQFASELKALLQLPFVNRTVNPSALDDYLCFQYVPHPKSIYEGIQQLPPAHQLSCKNGSDTVTEYWRPPVAEEVEETQFDSTGQVLKQLRDVLTEAVQLRLRSDVPSGAFLSGGVDSTLITGLMQQLSSQPVHSFSIGFPVASFDETKYSRIAAKHLGTNHHEFIVEPSAIESYPRILWHYDEPFSDSSAIPTLALCEVTRKQVTVALSGDGGDELFAGYERYRAVELASKTDRLPKFVRQILAHPVWQSIPTSTKQKSFGRRLKRFMQGLAESKQRRYLRWLSIFDHFARKELYTGDFLKTLNDNQPAGFIDAAYQLAPDRSFMTQTAAVDMLTYLPCDIMTKVDRASMAVSLEARSPLLDHKVVEFASRLPMIEKRTPVPKGILIRAFPELLPEAIWKRKKMGFGVPIDHWFRNELKEMLGDVLLSRRCIERGLFREEVIKRYIDDHLANRFDHSYRLWSLLILEGWFCTFMDAKQVPQRAAQTFEATN